MATSDIKKGILTSYGTFTVDILAGILFTPFLIRSLGQSEYGVFSLMGAFIASLAILDFGFGNAITRYVAQYRTEKRKEQESNFIAMCLVLYGFIACISFVVGGVFYFFLDQVYGSGLTAEELRIAKAIYLMLLGNITVSFFIGAFNAYIQAYEKFSMLNGITIVRLLLRISLLSLLLSWGFKSITVAAIDTVLNVATGFVYVLYARSKLDMRIKLSQWDSKLLREVTRYSFIVFIGSIADLMFWRIGLLVLGAVSGAKAVAVYAVGITLISYFQYISGVINGKLFPRVTQMVVEGADSRALTVFSSRVGRVQLMLLGCILMGFQLYGQQFIHLWIGPEYALSWWIGMILMGVMLVQALQYPCVMMLRAKKMDGTRTMYQLILMVVGAVLGVLLVDAYGVIGMTAGLALAIVALNWIVVNVHYASRLGYDLVFFVMQLSKLLPSMAAAYAAGFLIHLIPGIGWGAFCMKCILFAASYAALVWYWGANASEKAIISQIRQSLRPARAIPEQA
ncbi:hypothetical protein SY83_08175 [Paenibacillus swuensis]|uniref:Polysaccharide biosynthesis protein C-terminal domain-containing protein n=1 Tax=Paenibacillus swuensis TaxID=1178515 RepID=A0A172TH02_9BACL|nr:oligosaccharide flippase family protein [Paenibacillus swuensis]ANE46252.1 hypothetical protein SY83_08175 [Paenibacillus swuensis]